MPGAIIIVESWHHGNTRRIAEALAEALNAALLSPPAARDVDLSQYNLVGLGSGVYFGRLGSEIRDFVTRARALPAQAFLFSTAGLPFAARWWHRGVRRQLEARSCQVLGEFCCRGWDSVGPLQWIGGLNRRHPDSADLQRAREFARLMQERAHQPSSSSPD